MERAWIDIAVEILGAVGGLAGIGALIKLLSLLKADKKSKEIENEGKEIENEGKEIDNEHKELGEYRKLVDTLTASNKLLQDINQKQSEYYEKRITGLESRFSAYEKNVDTKVSSFKKRFDTIESELKMYKEAVLEAHRCTLPARLDDCPVISKLKLVASDCSDCTHKGDCKHEH